MRKITLSQMPTARNLSVRGILADISKLELISAEKEMDLAVRSLNGDMKARTQLIEANMRFVVTVAKKYQHMGLPLEDLISLGAEGLMTAVDQFDPCRGFKLISFAVWHIRQRIIVGLNNTIYTIRMPINKITIFRHLQLEADELSKEFGTEINERLAADLKEFSIEKLQGIETFSRPVSFSKAISDDGNITLEDALPDFNCPDPTLQPESQRRALVELLREILRKPEFEVITGTLGLNGTPESLHDLSLRMGVCRERCRQIRSEGMERMRKMARKNPKVKNMIVTLCTN
jgi:RNA polymerase primary sigma factor